MYGEPPVPPLASPDVYWWCFNSARQLYIARDVRRAHRFILLFEGHFPYGGWSPGLELELVYKERPIEELPYQIFPYSVDKWYVE